MFTIDGESVHPATAAAYYKLAAAFKAATGKELRVTSGHRTTAEQTALFLSRYKLQASGGGPYGDIRWWQGRRYVRVSAAGTVAVPGTSLHESLRALDLRDTGADAGVTVAGTPRANWLRANAPRFQFNPRGYNFKEPWHIEYTGSLTVPAGGGSTPVPIPEVKKKRRNMATLYNRNGEQLWALAGDSPGTTANWIEMSDVAVVNALSNNQYGGAVKLSTASWDWWKARYLEPVKVNGQLPAEPRHDGYTAEQVASEVKGALADDFAAVKAAIPTEFTAKASG